MDKLIAFLKEKFDRRLSRLKEILAEFIRKGEKSPAPDEPPTRSPSELKILAEVLKGTLQKKPKDLKALYSLGEAYIEMHRYGEAITPLQELTFYNPEHVKAHEQLGYAYDETLNGTKAISHILISQRFLVEKK